jgi:ABC-2 type transport system ATP-binding protein
MALDEVTITIARRECVAVLGQNGSGKSTLVRALSTLLLPDGGRARVFGHDVVREPAAVRRLVNRVSVEASFFKRMSAMENLSYAARFYGLTPSTTRSEIPEILERVGFPVSRASEPMEDLSRGMQQKVALARALLHEPSVVYLDEPTAGLDPLAARMVRDLIVGLKHASRSIVLCTHDLDEAERLADTVAILRRGRIVACDTPSALRAGASQSTLVQVMLAEPCPIALASIAGVDGALDPRAGGPAGLVLTYRTLDPERTNPQVVARLVAAGAAIVSVTGSTATLEEVFSMAVAAEPAA